MGNFDDLPTGSLTYRLIPVAVDLGTVRAGDSLVYIEGINKVIAVHTGSDPRISQSRPTAVSLELPKPDPKPRAVTSWPNRKTTRRWKRIPEINDEQVLQIFHQGGTYTTRALSDWLQLGNYDTDQPRRNKLERVIASLLAQELIIEAGDRINGNKPAK